MCDNPKSMPHGVPPHGPDQAAIPGSIPRLMPLLNPIAKVLLGAGVPMGFNGLITIPGRTTGLPRTTPLADHRARGQALGVVAVG